MCPVTERLYDHELFFHSYLYEAVRGPYLDAICQAFEKIWTHRAALADLADDGMRAIRRA